MPNLSCKQQIYSFLSHYYRKARRRLFRRKSNLILVMQQHLPIDPVIVEAGAHIGLDTLKFSQLWPQGHIHAFEPVPSVFSQLQQQVAGCTNVTCYPLALADKTGTVKIFVSQGTSNGSSSLLQPKKHLEWHPEVEFSQEAIEVPAQTLDDWAVQEQIARIDGLWLDLQGYELPVMQAATKTLQQVKVIVTEFANVELYSGQARFRDIKQWLEQHNFICIYREQLWLYGGNAIFVQRGSLHHGTLRWS